MKFLFTVLLDSKGEVDSLAKHVREGTLYSLHDVHEDRLEDKSHWMTRGTEVSYAYFHALNKKREPRTEEPKTPPPTPSIQNEV